jgi:hypothetical protein
MRQRRPGALSLLCMALSAAALSGCTNPDAPGLATPTDSVSSPSSPGEPTAPPPPAPSSYAPTAVQPSGALALAAFARLYVNWSYETLIGEQLTLAAMSLGAARLAERQAAATSSADSAIQAGHIHNSGRVVSIAPEQGRPRTWVIVTDERTGGSTQYEGLGSSYHVTLARIAQVPGGYAVSEWLPQS